MGRGLGGAGGWSHGEILARNKSMALLSSASIISGVMLAVAACRHRLWLQLPLPARQPQARTLLVIRASKLRKAPTQVTGIGPEAHRLQRHSSHWRVLAGQVVSNAQGPPDPPIATRTRCSPSYLIRRGFGERRLGRLPLMRCLSFAALSRSLGAASPDRTRAYQRPRGNRRWMIVHT